MAVRQHPPDSATSLPARGNLWAPALGVLIAFAGGVVAYQFMQSVLIYALIIVLSSVVAALLWRTWRAPLVAPAALWLGAVAADALYRAPDHLLSGAEVVMALDLLVVAALPAALGAAIGVAASMRLTRRASQ